MCTTGSGAATPVLPGSTAEQAGSALKIHRQELAKLLAEHGADFMLVSVHEREEPAGKTPPIPGTMATIPLGELLSKAFIDPEFRAQHAGKTRFITYCMRGYRGSVAARELTALGYNARYLDGGAAAWINPAVSNFDFVAVFAQNPAVQTDKLSMVLSLALAAKRNGNTVAVALMCDGVLLGLKDDPARSGVDGANPQPFQPVRALLDQLLAEGAEFFVCHSCVLSRKLEYSMMQPWVIRASAPDIVRWLQTSKGNVQFC